MLRQGDMGERVAEMQRLLSIPDDGVFGAQTRAAVVAAQARMGLAQDGIVGPATLNALREPDKRRLNHTDIVRAAQALDVPVAAVQAVIEVESRGAGFVGGKPAILFERHIMYRRTKADGMDADLVARAIPEIVNPQRGGYKGGVAEHGRLDIARRIHRSAAIESASWGLFQIMGFHCKPLGYESPEAFEVAMTASEGEQLIAFVRFIQADPAIHAALKRQEWADFARRYNGPAFAENRYDEKMAAAYAKYARGSAS